MDFLPYSRPLVDEDDIRAVVEVLGDPTISQGRRLERFEAAFAAYVGAPYAVAYSSGTAALHGMCAAIGLGRGDEVIVPALTFAGTANAVRYTGARPVFADIDPETLCLSPDAVRRVAGTRTRAVLTVDFAGHPSPYPALRDLAQQAGWHLLADAAHAPGARLGSARVGTLADMTAFSFNPVKNMTAAEGGMVTCSDARLAELLREFRTHGMTRNPARLTGEPPGAWYYEQLSLGFNYKLSELHAALGASQLMKLDAYNRQRRYLAGAYAEALAGLPLRLPVEKEGIHHVYHLYVARTQSPGPSERGRLFEALRQAQLGVQVHYIPVPLHPDYRALGYGMDDLPETVAYYDHALSLPLHPAMDDRDVGRVADAVRAFYS